MLEIASPRNNKFHYSPLRYPGGKTILFPFFDKVIKDNSLHNITYIEPYAGGAGAALALLFLEKVEQIIINDLDRAIYAFWRSAVFSAERFVAAIESIVVSVDEWKRQKAIYNDADADEFALGFATFFLNRTNISGILDGGPIGGREQTGKWKIDARFNKKTLSEKILNLDLYKNRISVFNQDGIELIGKYLNKKNTFTYLDPPYYEKGSGLYLNHYQKKNHAKLAKCLNQNRNATWLLTYDNKDEIKSLYPQRKIFSFSLNYAAYEARIGKEVLIVSDSIAI